LDLQEQINALLASIESEAERRGKPINIRPLILDLQIEKSKPAVVIKMHLRAQESATGRPDEVLSALGVSPAACLIERTRLIF